MEEPAFSSRGISTLDSGFECQMFYLYAAKELVNLHLSQGKRKGTDASCSSQGSTTGAVGEIVRVVWYFGQLDACHTIYWQHEYLSDY
jgi:hypothetical protein